MGVPVERVQPSIGSLLNVEVGKMKDGKIRFRIWPLISLLAVMMLLVSAAPFASAYSPSWATLTALNEGKAQAVAVADNANGSVYVFGGGIGISGSSYVSSSDVVLVYDVGDGTTTRAKSMLNGVRGACGGLGEDGRIYIFSGWNTTDVDFTQIYDIATDSWSYGSDIPSNVYKGDCVVVWPDFYVFGGTGADTKVQVYCPLNNSWYTGVGLPFSRTAGAAVYSEEENAIYYMGGVDVGDNVRSNVTRFDIESATWSSVASMPVARAAFDATVGVDGIIYVAGGSSDALPASSAVFAEGYYYCQNNDSWYQLTDMSIARKYLNLVSTGNGDILAIGGNDLLTIYGTVESLTVLTAMSSLSNLHIGQGTSAVLTLDFESLAAQEGANLTYYIKSELGSVYSAQNMNFAVAGVPTVIMDIPQSMPAGNYTLNLQWNLIFATGEYLMPDESIEFTVNQTIPLQDQISSLRDQLDNQLDKIMSLKFQIEQQLSDIVDLNAQLNQTDSDLANMVNQLEGEIQDAKNAANTYGMIAIIALALAAIMFIVMVGKMLMEKRK